MAEEVSTTDTSTESMITLSEEKREKYITKKENLQEQLKDLDDALKQYQDRYDNAIREGKKLSIAKKSLISFFENKYSRFIKEGLWNDSNYLSSDTYYLDSLRVMKDCSKAKLSYTFNVMDLRALPGYKGQNFKVRDKVSIEDIEFFGRNEKGTPIREEAIISEIIYDLDQPFNNTITVQNFETEFENLFERIGNAITTVELNK